MSADQADQEVLFGVEGRAGIITLNRPQALNAVTYNMVERIRAQLEAWADDDRIGCVIIEAAGGKAFSAGGDIRALYDWKQAQNPLYFDFFRREYALNAYIKTYPKPYVALIDGIVMGGGVGVSLHGSHRFGGENMSFAMPEVGIGFFPDIGGTWFLSRCPGETGMFLGLTGARLKAADAQYCGLITHATQSEALVKAKQMICASGEVQKAASALPPLAGEPPIKAFRDRIDACFSAGSAEEILQRLDKQGQSDEWCAKQAATIRTKSPTSLKIAFRQIREGRGLFFNDCMKMEFRIVSRIHSGHDFFEGTRAVVIDKDNRPQWQPATLAEVTDSMIDAYFAPLGERELLLP